MRRILIFLLAAILMAGCVSSRLHYFGDTPKKPGSYPRFTSGDSVKGYLDRYRACYDVVHYDLDLSLDPAHRKLGGTVRITFRAVTALDTIRIDLHRDLKIKNIDLDGVRIPFSRDGMAVMLSLPERLDTGKIYSLTVGYDGSPVKAVRPPWKGGVVWKTDREGNRWVGVACESEGGSVWFPCKDHLSDEPDSMRLRMSVPSGLQVVSNGILEEHSIVPGREVFTWSTRYPINIYNITFYAGRFGHIADSMDVPEGTLHLDYYVHPWNVAKAGAHFRQVKDVIRIYSRAFGPYPWIKEGFKLVESPYEGMENQTAIAYGSGFMNISWLGADYIIVHETAHEWWGNAVTVSDFSDIWLQEGFATYAEVVYVEAMKGRDTSLMYLNYWLAPSINNKLPVVGPRDVSYWDYNDGDVYNKGALVLHTIRNVINDSTLFFDILQTFYREHAGGSHVTTDDFREVLERKTGLDWAKFFEAYLYSRQVPVLKWYYGSVDPGRDQGRSNPVSFVAAKWTNVPEGFTMPVRLTCRETGRSEVINVKTLAKLFFLKSFSSCDVLSCNTDRSYFTAVSGEDLLREAEPEIPETEKRSVIVMTP